MKKYLLCLFILIRANLFGQVNTHEVRDFYHHFSLGTSLSIGRENNTALYPPKISFSYFDTKESGYDAFIGIHASAWTFIDYRFSAGVHTGLILSNNFSFEGALTYTAVPPQDAYFYYFRNTWQKLTFTPKIGLKLNMFWIKAGPSLILSSDQYNAPQSFFQPFDIRYYNLEMGIFVPIKIPNYKKINQFNNREL